MHVKHKRAVIVWLAIYPLITALYSLLGEYLVKLPLPLRTLVLTLIVVPLMVYVVLPLYYRIFNKWLGSEQ